MILLPGRTPWLGQRVPPLPPSVSGFFCSHRAVPRMAGTVLSAFPLKAAGSPEAFGGFLCLVAAEALFAASSLFVQHGLSLRLIASVGVAGERQGVEARKDDVSYCVGCILR